MASPVNTRTRVHSQEVALFTRQFVAMINAGIPLHKALDMYARGDQGKLGQVVDDLANRVLAGSTLSASLSYFPRIFSPVYVGITRAGEQSGRLHQMLEELAILLERQDGLRRKLTATLTYPAFLMVACLLCAGAFMFYILPAMGPLYTTLAVPLPWPTRMLVAIGELIKSPAFLGLTGLTVAFTIFVVVPGVERVLMRQPELRVRLHRTYLELPLVGVVLRKMIFARVLFTMATLLEVGIPAATALTMVRDVSSNYFVRRALGVSCQRLEQGCSLGECLDNLLPRGAVMMITVGEEASDITRAAQFVARVYEEDAEMSVSYFAALSEPLIMAGMGAVATFLILALILPIISLLQRM